MRPSNDWLRWRNFYADVGRRCFLLAFALGFLLGATVTNLPGIGAAFGQGIKWMEAHEKLAGWAQFFGAFIAIFLAAAIAWYQAMLQVKGSRRNQQRLIKELGGELARHLKMLSDCFKGGGVSQQDVNGFLRYRRDQHLSELLRVIAQLPIGSMHVEEAKIVANLVIWGGRADAIAQQLRTYGPPTVSEDIEVCAEGAATAHTMVVLSTGSSLK